MYALRRRSVECSRILLGVLKEARWGSGRGWPYGYASMSSPICSGAAYYLFGKVIDAAGQQIQNVTNLYAQLEIFCRSLRPRKICYL